MTSHATSPAPLLDQRELDQHLAGPPELRSTSPAHEARPREAGAARRHPCMTDAEVVRELVDAGD